MRRWGDGEFSSCLKYMDFSYDSKALDELSANPVGTILLINMRTESYSVNC